MLWEDFGLSSDRGVNGIGLVRIFMMDDFSPLFIEVDHLSRSNDSPLSFALESFIACFPTVFLPLMHLYHVSVLYQCSSLDGQMRTFVFFWPNIKTHTFASRSGGRNVNRAVIVDQDAYRYSVRQD